MKTKPSIRDKAHQHAEHDITITPDTGRTALGGGMLKPVLVTHNYSKVSREVETEATLEKINREGSIRGRRLG